MTQSTLSPDQFPDAVARRRIAEDLDTTFFVEAAAGTGKTTELVNRVLAILRSGKGLLEKMVAMTFTEKAAGEMKLRLREAIEQQRVDPSFGEQERDNIEVALQHLEVAHIGTVHSFCADVLRERPVEARVDPLFEVAAEEDSERLLDDVFEVWFQRTLDDPPEGIRRVLRRRPQGRRQAGPRSLIRSAVSSLIRHRDFPHPWRRDPFERNDWIDQLLLQMHDVATLADQAFRFDDWLAKNLTNLKQYLEENRVREAVRGRDYDALEAELRQLVSRKNVGWHWRGARELFGKGLPRSEVLQQRDALKDELDRFLKSADADLASCLREELLPVVDAYEAAKQRAGKLDFLDLLSRARDLIRDNQEVRRELQQRWQYFFVDEFQDTDPLQAEILLLLSASSAEVDDYRQAKPIPGKLFLVGDPKQSIYRFRRADIAMYERTKQRLSREHGAQVLHLQTSFRSVPEVQKLVNAAFEPMMQSNELASQPDYVALESFRPAHPGQPAVIALPVPRPYTDYGKIANYAIDQSLPDAVAAFIDWLVNQSNWQVTDRDKPDQTVPIQPQHICILFRRLRSFQTDVTRAYVNGLEARRIPHVLIGGHSFHNRDEVLAIRNALNAVEWPDDMLRVYATLRGPFFALGDDALLSFRDQIGHLHPLARIDSEKHASLDEGGQQVATCLKILGDLHRSRNHRPIAETITRLLEAIRAHAGIAIWPTGEQALANCLQLVDRARRFERHGAPSFRAFINQLEDEADTGGGEESPVVEEGTEGVRMMTVHRAKGLEFPVVILADPTCKAARVPPSQYVDSEKGLFAEPLCGAAPHELRDNEHIESQREQDEAIRVAYVAATRARDLLVVPAVGDESVDSTSEVSGWMDVLRPAIFPAPQARRTPAKPQGCPEMGNDTVVFRPDDQDSPPTPVAPGLHRSTLGNEVVWWDPTLLDLDQEVSIGLRQDRLLQVDEAGVVAQQGIEAHNKWQEKRKETLIRGEKPTVSVQSATSVAHDQRIAIDGETAIKVVELDLPDRSRRPRGKRFGSLVHAVLAMIDLDASETHLSRAIRTEVRRFNASDEEANAAFSCIAAALTHDLFRRAAACAKTGDLRREVPVLVKDGDNSLVEGTVDMAFQETINERQIWTVIDFKTDHQIGDHLSSYRRQIAIYCDAIRQATSKPARGVLLVL